jgi:prophage regulatory protein
MPPANDNDCILVSLNTVARMTSLSRTAINKRRAEGTFPKAVPLGDRRIAFVTAEVLTWMADRIAARDALSTSPAPIVAAVAA